MRFENFANSERYKTTKAESVNTFNKKARRSSHKNHMKESRKRTEEDDVRFAQSFEKLILIVKSKEGI